MPIPKTRADLVDLVTKTSAKLFEDLARIKKAAPDGADLTSWRY